MHAICFSCGLAKIEALKMCRHCQAVPQTRQQRIVSVALSDECLRQENLVRASDYIQRKNRLPRFHENVKNKATEIVERQLVAEASCSQSSFELSTSFFDFDDLVQDVGDDSETITVHAIGKPERLPMDVYGDGASGKTYHTLQWEIGADISATDVEANMANDGCLYVWFSWRNDRWNWKNVSKTEFSQLRQVEGE